MDVIVLNFKIILLFIVSSLIIYITYNHTYKKTINVISINSLEKEENYNLYLSELLSRSKLNYKYNIDYSNENLEIENLILKIESNDNNIQESLHKADVVLLSVGNIDYEIEDLNTIIKELNTLFKKIRLLNNKQIFYIIPSKIKNTIYIKDMCHKYNIIFINGSSLKNRGDILSQIIFKKVESTYTK